MNKVYSTIVFIDRDGTVNVNMAFPNVNRPEKLQLLPIAAEAIKILNDMNAQVIVVTNQAGINNPDNDFTPQDFKRVSEKLDSLLKNQCGAWVDDTFCCPHFHTESCGCRKPKTGLFEKAREKYGFIKFKTSFIIGDRTDDIIAGKTLGMTTILVRTGHGIKSEESLQSTENAPDYVVDDLYQAALKIKESI